MWSSSNAKKCKLIVSGQVVERTWTVKEGRKATTAMLVGGVGGVQLTVCPVSKYSTILSGKQSLVYH